MATSPRPIDTAQLSNELRFNPNIVADPVPWWWMQHLDKNALGKLAQISMQRQKEVLAAQTKALDAALKALGT